MIIAWTKWMEKKISCSNFLVNLYEIYYRKTVKREIQLAEVNDGDRILCIGGGSIPCTAIQIANLTRAEIDVIDIDCNAVANAKHLIRRMGLGKKVNISLCKGEEIDVSSYDVIHIALQVAPKEKVVEHIWSNSRVGTRIIVRMPKKRLRCFYSNISSNFSKKVEGCTKTCSLINRFDTMDQALLLVKS